MVVIIPINQLLIITYQSLPINLLITTKIIHQTSLPLASPPVPSLRRQETPVAGPGGEAALDHG